MALAETRFDDVLNYISDSQLNFFIQKTPFSAQISLKKSFAQYFKKIEDVSVSESSKIKETEVEVKHEAPEALEQENFIIENLKAIIVENHTEIDELKRDKKELEAKLKESKRESKKNRQRAKRQDLFKKNKEEHFEESDKEETNKDLVTLNTFNRFSLLAESPEVSKDNLKKDTVTIDHKHVQTETQFYTLNCFYCEKLLQSRKEISDHRQACHGRPWFFSCQKCSLRFVELNDLKNHKMKVHDPEDLLKLTQVFKEIFKSPEKNHICRDCSDKFELESELELHILTSHGAWKEMLSKQ